MDFIIEENRIVLKDVGQEAGEITWFKEDNILNVDHTIVNENYSGMGIGKKLVKHLVDYARENNLMITPICPYAKAQLEKTEEYHDVLKR